MRFYSGREIKNVQRSLSEMTSDEVLSFVVGLLEENEQLKREVLQLKAEASDMNWTISPDRMGGAYSQDEINNAYAWKQYTEFTPRQTTKIQKVNMSELLPCPFCGFEPSMFDSDCIYPVTKATDKLGNYRVYGLHCYTSGGGCSAQILGDSRDDCIDKWNTRV